MTRNGLWRMVLHSEPQDWIRHRIGNGVTESVFIGDVWLRFINDPSCGVRGNPDVDYPDQQACSYELHLLYDASLVDVISVVPVEHGNAFLPFPKPNTNSIPLYIVKAAEVGIPRNELLYHYLTQYGMEIKAPRVQTTAGSARGGR